MTASLRSAAQQALAALFVLSDDNRCSAHSWDDSYASEAMEALRAALGTPEAEPKAEVDRVPLTDEQVKEAFGEFAIHAVGITNAKRITRKIRAAA